MTKNLLLSCLCLLQAIVIYAAEPKSLRCAPELKHYLETLQQLPQIQKIITEVQQEGDIRIEVNRIQLPSTFGAFWDMDRRIIYVNLSPNRQEGELIASILFELHNALANTKLEELDALARQGKIDRKGYIEAVEWIEYENSRKASALSLEGIQKKIFPQNAFLPVYPSFQEYFRVQQQAGHSAWIGQTYDQLSPYATPF